MTVRELIEMLLRCNNLNAPVFVQTPIPTEMYDCQVTGIRDANENDDAVWIQWPTENAGSGMNIGDTLVATEEGLKIDVER